MLHSALRSYRLKWLLTTARNAAFVVAALIVLTFLIVRLIPGDPAARIAGAEGDAAHLAELRKQLGLDRSIAEQFGRYISALARGDLGTSFVTHEKVEHMVSVRLPYTLALASCALAFVVVVGFSFGFGAAILCQDGRHPLAERTFTAVTGVSSAIPELVCATLAIYAFAVVWELFPISGATGVASIILPSLCLGLRPAFNLARVVRVETANALRMDYIRTAKSKRIAPRRIYARHLFRNVVAAALSMAGLIVPLLIGGAVVVENVFAWPGLGTAVVHAVTTADYPVIQGLILMLGLIVLCTNITIDLLISLIDPRSVTV